jgi:hypothetical protein
MDLTTGSRPSAVVALVSLVLVLVLILAVAACGGSTPTPSPSPSPSPAATPPTATASPLPSNSPAITGVQVCADLATFQSSLDALTGLDLASAGVLDVIRTIQSAITSGLAFVDSARGAFGPEAQALGTALADLQTALQGITGEGSLGDKAATIENAVDEVAAAFDALKAEVAPGCPSPAASAS